MWGCTICHEQATGGRKVAFNHAQSHTSTAWEGLNISEALLCTRYPETLEDLGHGNGDSNKIPKAPRPKPPTLHLF